MKIWYVIFFAVILVSCTDYVNQIEDEREDWRNTQELAALSSSSEIVKSSSSSFDVILSGDSYEKSSSSSVKSNDSSSSAVLSGDSREESSSSAVKSCSSKKIELSSSSKDPEPAEGSSSSSEKVVSSSSSEKIASSSSEKASWAYLNPAISYGEMIDDRDGQVYKTVVIGEQTWMAENLNLEAENSFCYNDSANNCAKYGRLYTWAAALDACPTDWHLPDSTEWNYLIDVTGGELEAGTSLKSIRASSDAVIDNGSDEYGFSAVAAGRFENNSAYRDLNTLAYFWSSSERSTTVARMLELSYRFSNAVLGGEAKSVAISVRCLKNGNETLKSSSSEEVLESSSSAVLVPPCKTGGKDDCEYGSLLDLRDNRTYKTVKIGNQVWMAENLNYYPKITDGSSCYNKESSYCATYGRLYSWEIAQSSCPDDWHIPSVEEFNTLIENIGGSLVAGAKLKAASGWDGNGNGSDEYGFSALPAGTFDGFWTYNNLLNKTDFWASEKGTEGNSPKGLYMGSDIDEARITSYGSTSYGFSVRCVKD